MKKILVPCDFSTTAINAFRFALDVAKQSTSSVHLLFVVELPVLHDSMLMPALYFEKAFMADLKLSAQKRLDKLIAKYNKGNTNVTSYVDFGATNKMIRDYAKKQAVDMIIMGSHGASGIREFVIGSNAAKIVRTSAVPVIVIKDKITGPIKRIVFPNALEDDEQVDLFMRVKALQNFFKAHLYLVWINTLMNFTSDDVTRPKLQKAAKQFDLKNCTLDIFNFSDQASGIIAYTQMVKGNLIVMGTHGRTGAAHIFKNSITEEIVNHVSTPVWTFVSK